MKHRAFQSFDWSKPMAWQRRGLFIRWACRNAIAAAISLYRLIVSPVLLNFYGPACRFEPNCSLYAREAILRHGLFYGGGLAVRRLLRCRPGGDFGFDPVPSKRTIQA
jgi:uncharacterized protein